MISRTLRSCWGALAACAISSALGQGYAQKTVQIAAGNLIVESQRTGSGLSGAPLNPTPHVWSALDGDRSAKPAGWSFYNPRAQTVATVDQIQRWLAIHSWLGIRVGELPTAGTRLTKKMAPYWEVLLDSASDQVLAAYNVLLLSVQGSLVLNPREREKLRKYVDQGGVLWIDFSYLGSPTADPLNPPPLPFELAAGSGGPLQANPYHPLLTTPNLVTSEDLFFLQGTSGAVIGPVSSGAVGSLDSVQSWLVPDSFKLRPIVGETPTLKTVAVGEIGDGTLVVTSRGVAMTINRGFVNGGVTRNGAFFADQPARDGAFAAGAKLVVNAISLNSSFSSTAQGSRKTSSSSVEIAAPLLRRFTMPFRPNGTSSVLYKGRFVCVSGSELVVLDANPSSDLDQNGNPDDGIPDAPDSGGDILWRATVGGNASPPTVTEVPGAPLADQILVTTGAGALAIYPLDPPDPTNVSPLATIAPPSGSGAVSGQRIAPTVHEGLAFMADANLSGQGRIWVADLAAGQRVQSSRAWSVEGANRLPEPSGSLTVAYIPVQDNSGGVDRVVYAPTMPSTTDRRPAGITSLWLGARGENPVNVQVAGSNLIITTRASLQNLPIYNAGANSSLGVKVSLVEVATGQPFGASKLKSALTGSLAVNQGQNGQMIVGFNPSATTPSGETLRFVDTSTEKANTSVRLDYTIDWGAPTSGMGATTAEAYVRGDLQFPDQSTPTRMVQGSVAVAATGNLFVVTGPAQAGEKGGSLFALREEGRGEFRLLYRWELFDGLKYTLNNATGTGSVVDYEPAIIDYDGVLDFPVVGAILNQPMINLSFRSGPTVRGDTVYVVANAGKSGFLAAAGDLVGTLLAFNANPMPAELTLSNLPPSFSILQPDVARTDKTATTPTLSSFQPGNYTYEVEPGLVSKGRLRVDNMMTVRRGRIRDSLAINAPIILRVGGQSDILVEPELSQADGTFVPGNGNGRWSPLRWYTTFNGLSSATQPIVTGNTAYVGGTSSLPTLFNSNFTQFTPTKGLIYGLDCVISPNDLRSPSVKHPWMKNGPRTWQRYLSSITVNAGGVSPSPYYRWPQYRGVTTFDDFKVRLNQAVLDDPAINGLVAGEGVVAAWGNGNLYGFSRADFLIADEGRLLRIDSAGNPIWSSLDTLAAGEQGPTGTASKPVSLASPSRIYPASANTYWVVDTGNDRIVRIDSSGREQRSIAEFKVDPVFKPLGLSDNETRKLRQPRDFVTFTSTVLPAANPFQGVTGPEVWRHYLIADSANFRVIELVDRFQFNPSNGQVGAIVEYIDPASDKPGKRERAIGLILWHSRPELSGKGYAYNSIARVFVPDGTGQKAVYAFGFGNLQPGRGSFGLDSSNPRTDQDVSSGLGGIVLYDPSAGASELVTQVVVPPIPQGTFWTSSGWTSPATGTVRHKLAGLTSVTLRYVDGNALPALMFTDATGVYEALKVGSDWNVRWMLPNAAGTAIRRRLNLDDPSDNRDDSPVGDNPNGFRATYARRLDSGEVVVANAYYGKSRNDRPFSGEVFLVDGSINPLFTEDGFGWNKRNLGFNSRIVKFELPPIEGIRGLVAPVFADRR